MRIDNYNRTKIFVWNNRFKQVTYTNSTGATVNLRAGRLMGRITASQKALPHVSTATDGSEQPVFICADDYDVANGATITISVCDAGDVSSNKITFGGAETLATLIPDDVSIEDALYRNSQIRVIKSDQLTGYDNQ